jgi:hypothetical protein
MVYSVYNGAKLHIYYEPAKKTLIFFLPQSPNHKAQTPNLNTQITDFKVQLSKLFQDYLWFFQRQRVILHPQNQNG